MYKLENWAVVSDPYRPPELGVRLRGYRVDDSKKVLTSAIIGTEGRFVQTRNSVYELGEPEPEYAKWCEEHGKPIDPANPVTMITSIAPVAKPAENQRVAESH